VVPEAPPRPPALSRRRFILALAVATAGVAGGGLELFLKRGGHSMTFHPLRLRPSQVLDLSRWKIGLPTTKEVTQPELDSFTDPSFTVVTVVQFTARAGDPAQEGSKYARSELREMADDGSPASWSTESGSHTLSLTQRITHLPEAKPQLIFCQIHSAKDYLILVEIDGNQIYVRKRDDMVGVLDADYRLGTMFDLELAAADGYATVTYNGQPKVRTPLAESGCYFKAGCYVQSNTGSGDLPTAYGQVEIARLEITHR
jgi:hypothetical protein